MSIVKNFHNKALSLDFCFALAFFFSLFRLYSHPIGKQPPQVMVEISKTQHFIDCNVPESFSYFVYIYFIVEL